ncbi:MAG: AI-2E family transporter [Acidimicrobiia bacterium]|nr:AI-2E family transporter [Acidimicrobiia bacterium]
MNPTAVPPWLNRAMVLFFVGLVALFVSYWLLLRLRTLLILVLVSLFLSFAIEPAVNFLARRGWRRGPATGMVFGGVFIIGVAFIAAIGALVANQVSDFIDEAPDYVARTETWVNERFNAEIDADALIDELKDENGPVRDFATGLAGNALDVGATVLALIFQLFTIALFTFYLVADGPRLRRTLLSALPPQRQRFLLQTWELAIDKTGGYIYSRALLAVISAVVHWIAFSIIGVPFAVALALWVGVVSQFIPTVGTYLAGALAVLVALLSDPVDAVWVLGFIVVYQQVENYLLQPRVTARTMALHPAVAFGAVIAGAGLIGPVGALLALPAAAVIQAFVSTYLRRHDVLDESSLTDEPAAGRPWKERWPFRNLRGAG